MTALRMEVMNTLEQVPEENLQAVLDIIKKFIVGDDELKKSQEAYERLMENFSTIKTNGHENYEELLEVLNLNDSTEFDYRDEVAREVLKKYASLG